MLKCDRTSYAQNQPHAHRTHSLKNLSARTSACTSHMRKCDNTHMCAATQHLQATGQRISKVRKQQKKFQFCQSYSNVNRKVWYISSNLNSKQQGFHSVRPSVHILVTGSIKQFRILKKSNQIF